MGETVRVSKKLLVAPNCLQNRLLDMIEEEIRHAKRGEEAYIGVKMNSLTDKKLMDKLIEASQAAWRSNLLYVESAALSREWKGIQKTSGSSVL